MPKLSEILSGKKGKVKQKTLQTKDQQDLMKLINQGLTEGTGPLADLFGEFNEEQFQKGVSEPALKNFKENILPQLQEGFNTGGAFSSGRLRAENKAGTDLQSQLNQLMYQAQQDQLKNKLSGVQQLLGTQAFENVYRPKQQGATEGFVKGFASSAGEGLGSALTGGLAKTPTATPG